MRVPHYEDLTTALYLGDCREVMAEMPENSVDAIATDPPYLISFMGKAFDTQDGASSDPKKMQEWHRLWAVEALRVLKPGGHALVMGGTRTYHRLVCGLEDAGFECRDCCMYLYGVGFPKSLDIAKAITKAELGVPQGGPNPLSPNTGKYKGGTIKAGHPTGRGFGAGPGQFLNEEEVAFDMEPTDAARQWEGWGTALKPAVEIIVLCRKPLSEPTVAQNVLRWGVGGLNIDGCRIPYRVGDNAVENGLKRAETPRADIRGGGFHTGTDWSKKRRIVASGMTPEGRWPANLLHDGSDEVLALFPDSKGQQGDVKGTEPSHTDGEDTNCYGEYGRVAFGKHSDGNSSAARFFYCSKASRSERDYGLENMPNHTPGEVTGGRQEGSAGLDSPRAGAGRTSGGHNGHPTVKPLSLMRWLCRLIAPPGGVVLDPFMGSGTTRLACLVEGFQCIGIDQDQHYLDIAASRLVKPEDAQ